jgi:hypothetical protein
MSGFVHVTSTSRDGDRREHIISLTDIISANSHRGKTIIAVRGSDYQIWADVEFEEFLAVLKGAGADIFATGDAYYGG